MENRKTVLVAIIVLLFICVPATIIGYVNRYQNNQRDNNINHSLFYNGYLWFYDANGNLMNKYQCETSVCQLAKTSINEEYDINYYKDGTNFETSIIDYKYAFINDGNVIKLYNTINGDILKLKDIKNYGIEIEYNNYILQNEDGLWGVLSVGDVLGPTIAFDYDYIGLKNDITEEGRLKADRFIVLKAGNWSIINSNTNLSGNFQVPIVDYNDNYIITKNNDIINIHNYDGTINYLERIKIDDYVLDNGYVGIISNNSLSIYKDLNELALKNLTINSGDEVKFENDGSKINVMINGEVKETLDIIS